MSLKMLENGKSLIESMSDEMRIPIVIDHQTKISALSLWCHWCALELDSQSAANGIKTACETLFALGYQAGLQVDQLDPEIWKLD